MFGENFKCINLKKCVDSEHYLVEKCVSSHVSSSNHSIPIITTKKKHYQKTAGIFLNILFKKILLESSNQHTQYKFKILF